MYRTIITRLTAVAAAGATAVLLAGPAQARNAGLELPAKLIISAPKRLLDEVGTGKMSLAEFKKAASIEFLTFPGTKSSPTP